MTNPKELERFRWRAAAEILAGFCKLNIDQYSREEIAKDTVRFVDALIAELQRTAPAPPACMHIRAETSIDGQLRLDCGATL